MEWTSAAISDRGLVRERNEDAFLRLDHGVFAVADGMGGHPAGEVASQIAVERVRDAAEESGRHAGWLGEAVRSANRSIRERAVREPGEEGMGTTLSVLELDVSGRASIAHIGDCRVYLWRDEELRRLTRDDTALQEAIESGRVDPAREPGHPLGSVLTRVLGLDDDVEPHMEDLQAREGDLFLLCSDGICGVLSDGEIARALREHPDPGEALAELVEEVNQRGAPDNATAVSVRVAPSTR
jgi:serine/threonine protein phosphatase PrpC